MKVNKLSIKIMFAVALLTLTGLQIWNIRRHSGDVDQQILGGRVGLPPSGEPENPTVASGPLHVAKAVADAKQLYKDIQTYRRLHGGQMPEKEIDFEVDRMNNYKQYGYTVREQPDQPFGMNPDMQLSDVPAFRNQWKHVDPFIKCLKRPDGTDIGGPKKPGTRDILAYSRMYYHLGSRHYNGFKDTISPRGFFLVIWDDGSVQQVPFTDEMFIKVPGREAYTRGFKGQAGVPPGSLPFDDFYATMPRK